MLERNVLQVLIELIKIRSTTPPGNVSGVADYVVRWGQELGAELKRQPVEPAKENIILTLDFGPGPVLLLNTHMDVNNPAGQTWETDPFEPKITGDRVFGLGACDAKGSLAAMLAALRNLHNEPSGLAGRVILTAVMGEEAGGIGSLFLVNQGIHANGAIVGEPSGLNVAIAHKGTYMRRIRFKGKEAHSASPHLGINAISHAARFCVEYDRLNEELKQTPHPVLGPANASVTLIQGGTRQNTIPGFAEIMIDRRLVPGETHAKADGELQAILDRLAGTIPELKIESVEKVVATIPSETKASERIVTIACQAAGKVLNTQATPQAFNAGCDMSKLVTIAKIPTVIVGPGHLAQAHSPNEFVDIPELQAAEKIYELAARQFLSPGN
jgi:acetylornithine deacetylase/succinyl-diaminopimelate desuccinylase family protein